MSSRALQKAQLRAEREAAQRREAERLRHRRVMRLWALAAVLAVAVGTLAAVSLSRQDGGAGGAAQVAGVSEGAAMLAGIPQSGTVLGDPAAEVTLTEFADLQCPYCKQYALGVLPQIIETYVRPGKVKLDLQLLRFIGPDSGRGAQAALAGAEQGRMWHFVDLWYRNQGTENTGYGDDAFIERLGTAAGVMRPLTTAHETALQSAEQQAATAGIDSTPSFLLDGEPFVPQALSFDAFRTALDAAVKG